jgi:hypothetical protein
MKREQLEHVLREASQIADDHDVLVIGSQSVLGAIPEHRLPPTATASIEVDVAFFNDPDDRKADQVDGAIGELSPFHETLAITRRASASRPLYCRMAGLIGWCSWRPRAQHRVADICSIPMIVWSRSWSPVGRRITHSRSR